MTDVIDGIKKNPHPEEAAKRPSRRTHSGDPADRRILQKLPQAEEGVREAGGWGLDTARFYRPRTRGMIRVGQGSGISPTGTSISDGPRRFKAARSSRRNSSGLVARTPAMP